MFRRETPSDNSGQSKTQRGGQAYKIDPEDIEIDGKKVRKVRVNTPKGWRYEGLVVPYELGKTDLSKIDTIADLKKMAGAFVPGRRSILGN